MKAVRGYILVECLVAMSILSLGMISVNSALSQANFTRAIARDRSDARFMLETLMGSVMIQPVIDAGTWKGGFEDQPRFSYEYTVRVASIPDPPSPRIPGQNATEDTELPVGFIGHLRATVTWTRLGESFSETYETLFPPERLPQVQMQEYQFQQRLNRTQGSGSVGFSETGSAFESRGLSGLSNRDDVSYGP